MTRLRIRAENTSRFGRDLVDWIVAEYSINTYKTAWIGDLFS